MANICLMASGQGTNVENIINYFKGSDINVNFIATERICRASKIAFQNGIDHHTIINWNFFIRLLKGYKPDLVVLSGFLKLVPKEFLDEFKVINIHPSLLPKFGGKGMWGINVHKAVIQSGEKESGISIHWVNNEYDRGEIIAQFKCVVEKGETPETLQSKIKELEIKHFPEIIASILK